MYREIRIANTRKEYFHNGSWVRDTHYKLWNGCNGLYINLKLTHSYRTTKHRTQTHTLKISSKGRVITIARNLYK